MKINIVAVGLVIAILASGTVYLLTSRISQNIQTTPSNLAQSSPKPVSSPANSSEPISKYTPQGPAATITDKVYTNKTYGFSLTLPRTWTKYTVQEFKQADGSSVIMFGLPLETNQIAQWTSPQEKKNKNFEIWSLHVMSSELWQKVQTNCQDADNPCFAPIELSRNSSYVYGSGQFITAGGWEPCSAPEDKNSEPYFCTVYRDLLPEKNYSIEKSFTLL